MEFFAILIGSSGQVASRLIHEFQSRRIPFISSTSKNKEADNYLDLASAESIGSFFEQNRALWTGREVEVFLPGALTHVDKCETERDLCYQINFLGPKRIAEICQQNGFGITFYSTEYVFGEAEYHGGAIGPFSEADTPAPTSWYGQCKLDAERAIQSLCADALILRTTMVFSWDTGMNFFMQYYRHLQSIQQNGVGTIFKIPEDQISTPTYATSLSKGAVDLRTRGVSGLVNLVGSDLVSRKELVLKVIDEFGFDKELSLRGFQFLKTKELLQVAKRPLSAGLTCEKAMNLGLEVLPLKEAFLDIKKRAAVGP